MNRREIAEKEGTRDPIFLFQIRDVHPNQECRAEYDNDGEYMYDPDTKISLDDDDLIRRDWAVAVWRTENVFLTREEGEFYGERTKHRNGKGRKGIDWMVYCCALEKYSELATMLSGTPTTQTENVTSTQECIGKNRQG